MDYFQLPRPKRISCKSTLQITMQKDREFPNISIFIFGKKLLQSQKEN